MAAGEIVPGAAIVRALAATLGDAQRFLAAIERALPLFATAKSQVGR
jgi:hypothetical protein